MLVTADQLVAHAVGDYILQSDWMANEKTKQHTAALDKSWSYCKAKGDKAVKATVSWKE